MRVAAHIGQIWPDTTLKQSIFTDYLFKIYYNIIAYTINISTGSYIEIIPAGALSD